MLNEVTVTSGIVNHRGWSEQLYFIRKNNKIYSISLEAESWEILDGNLEDFLEFEFGMNEIKETTLTFDEAVNIRDCTRDTKAQWLKEVFEL